MERLKEIGKTIREKEKTLRSDPELKSALEKADELKEKAEKSLPQGSTQVSQVAGTQRCTDRLFDGQHRDALKRRAHLAARPARNTETWGGPVGARSRRGITAHSHRSSSLRPLPLTIPRCGGGCSALSCRRVTEQPCAVRRPSGRLRR